MKRNNFICLFLLCGFLLLLMVGCGNSSISDDLVDIQKIQYAEEGFFTDSQRIVLEIQNNSTVPIDVKMNLRARGKHGNYLEDIKATVYSINPRSAYYLLVSNDDEIADVDVEYECVKASHETVAEEDYGPRFYDYDGSGKLTVKNNSGKEIAFCRCALLFFDEAHELISVKYRDFNKIPKLEFVEEDGIYLPDSYASAEVFSIAYY